MTLQTMSFIFGALLLAVAILGGALEVKEIKVSNVTRTGRVLAGLVGLVFIGLGFWSPNFPPNTPTAPLAGPAVSTPAPPTGPTVATPTAARTVTMSKREDGKDREGGDYTNPCLNMDQMEDCERACKDAERCVAWTYVKPSYAYQRQALCCLKNVVTAIKDAACCVTGTKIPAP
jgi:hypothetical protein